MTEAQIAALAGEHFVAHRIAMLGFIPTLVRERMPRIDLLVSSADGDKTIAMQIKCAANATCDRSNSTASGDKFSLRFPLGHRAIAASGDRTFFCFVDLRRITPSAIPDVYVIPSIVLKQEYETVYLRRYTQVFYERPWAAMQRFRNNWQPIVEALSDAPPTADFKRRVDAPSFADRCRNELLLAARSTAAR